MKYLLFLFLGILQTTSFAQNIPASLLNETWKAQWIAVPGESSGDYGVFLFRKKINLSSSPSSFVVHVSADNRYKLFVNGQQVSLGPARGDLQHWNFETLDIAPFLKAGFNIISAQVWNEGKWRAEGQISLRSAFILQGNESNVENVNTDTSWKCIRDISVAPLTFNVPTYYVAGPGESVDMEKQLAGWAKAEYNDGSWKNAELLMPGLPKGLIGGYGSISGWLLIPSEIPQMELKMQRLAAVKSVTGLNIPEGFPATKTSFRIPGHSEVVVLLDQGFLTNAYPQIEFSGGKNSSITLGYAEALFTKYPSKGNRNETDGKIFMGRRDSIISNGGAGQSFTSLTYRTYRYIQLKIITSAEPLTIDDFYGMATGYPFQMTAHLVTEDPEMTRMLEIGWRTAKLCAMETYMDCPYYEQLQYIGDARIQALVSLYNSGDERLLRNAMNEMDNSRQPEGITLSRHPSFTPQFIPPFSLWYIGMLHDYMMYGRDSSYLKNKLAGERDILHYFRTYQLPNGSLKEVPYWLFSDWVESKGWASGRAPIGSDGSSAVLDLQLLWAYQLAADIETHYGMPSYALLYAEYADQLKKTIREKYWDDKRKLYADRPERDLFSQHANILAILTGMTDSLQASALAPRILTDTSLALASIYFKFYLNQSLVKAGLGNNYMSWLGQWRDNIKMGMTTWAEISDINNARSDCHAWGASPNIEFFRTVLGIDSKSPGFKKVKIEPHLGTIKKISGDVPHPDGKISVAYIFENNTWTIRIELPSSISGDFVWKNSIFPLKDGLNIFKFKD